MLRKDVYFVMSRMDEGNKSKNLIFLPRITGSIQLTKYNFKRISFSLELLNESIKLLKFNVFFYILFRLLQGNHFTILDLSSAVL